MNPDLYVPGFRRAMLRRLLAVGCVVCVLTGCAGADQEARSRVENSASVPRPDNQSTEVSPVKIQVTSEAFGAQEVIPRKYTEDGADVSPPLAWSGVPEDAVELALICDDPDAPRPDPWVHWLLYKIPASVDRLPEDLPKSPTLDGFHNARQGRNSWPSGQTVGYRGPAPPTGHGTHHYHFKLYALDTPLQLEPGADKAALLDAMQGHVLAESELVGTYER